MHSFPILIEKLLAKTTLSTDESFFAMREILLGKILPTQVASFLTALRSKGESVDEIVGFVRAMRESMSTISCSASVVVDTCGTGGDIKGTFNISTAAAFVVAGAGLAVAKHGNRSVSSQCGSADVLESAGVKIDMSKEIAERCLNEIGITFLFAPLYHPAMKNVAPIRKELGIRTVFNLLGPLVNPAHANVQVIGMPKKELVPLMGKVLLKLSDHKKYCATVIHESGYDEVVLLGKCYSADVLNHKMRLFTLTPKNFGMKKSKSELLKGSDAFANANLLRAILSGQNRDLDDVVIANASLALFCAEKLLRSPIKRESFTNAVKKARESLQSGAAMEKLNQLVEWSHKN